MKIEKDVQFRGETYKVEIEGYGYKISTKDRVFKGYGIDLTKDYIKKLILEMNGIPHDVYKYEKFMEWDGIIE